MARATMRIRQVKPDFWLDEKMAALTYGARLFYIGLWTQCDREGRLKDNPRRLKVALLPYDDIDCDKMLNVLVEAGCIVRYEVEGERYIWVPTFNKHQYPNSKELPSTIPAPCQHDAGTPLIGLGMEGLKGGVARETAPKSTDFPQCMSEEWSVDGDEFVTGLARILSVAERKVARPLSTQESALIGGALTARCPEGCTGNVNTTCAADLIGKLRKTSIKAACDYYVRDYGRSD
jgi:hypothetical protein